MVDEVELVRRFRAEVPEPSPQARAQAWAAVMTVAAEEGAQDGAVRRPIAPGPSAAGVPRRRSPAGGARGGFRPHRSGGDSHPFGH